MMYVILNVKTQTPREGNMARSQAEKEATHRRIVKAAAAQIRRDGVDAVRVSELMREAGLTHGGFYRHFGSREDLIDEAIDAALTDGSRQADTGESLEPGAELAQIIDGYVSKAHRDNPQVGCAVAALPTDVSRCGSRARHAYSRQVRRYIDRLVGLIRQAEPETKRDEAILTLSALVGAVAMARAVDDPELSDEILTHTASALHRRAHEAAG
jgi:TetR/AcrR family transcriptional regulator, transcriptional repressor for nem operon